MKRNRCPRGQRAVSGRGWKRADSDIRLNSCGTSNDMSAPLGSDLPRSSYRDSRIFLRPKPLDALTQNRMRLVKQSGTRCELELRRALHAMGFRYHVNCCPISGLRSKADIVFSRYRVAVYVDGCYWHNCPTHGTRPKNNASWWAEKLERNRERDHKTAVALRNAGWTVIRIWEHEDSAVAARLVADVLKFLK